jgi:hypothetical protein
MTIEEEFDIDVEEDKTQFRNDEEAILYFANTIESKKEIIKL